MTRAVSRSARRGNFVAVDERRDDEARPDEATPNGAADAAETSAGEEGAETTAVETAGDDTATGDSGDSPAVTPDTSEVEAVAVANGQAEPSPTPEEETSAVAVTIGDTAEVTALDPHEDHLADVADPDFPIGLRGYDRAAVDAYVIHVTELVAELQSVRSPKAAVKKALDRVGRETTAILQRAEEAADETTADSRRRAEERVQQAESEAERIVKDAHARVKQLDADTEALWAERRRLIEDVRRVSDALRESADQAIARFPAEDEADDAPATTPSPAAQITEQLRTPPGQ